MNGFRKYIIFGALILIGYFTLQYFKPKPTNWAPTYLSEDKIPFGTFILRQQIHDIFPDSKIKTVQNPIYNTLKEKPKGASNLLIIASNLKIDRIDYQEMVKYMQKGGNIFLAAYQIKGVLLDTLNLEMKSDFTLQNQRKYPINFVNSSLKREYDYFFDKGISEQYFNKIDSSRAIVLGLRRNEQANFIQYKFGGGSLFILPNPQLLTNYSLLREDGQDYAAKALSYLPQVETLIWDEHFTKPDTQNISPLRVLFHYDQLRWAYYIALLSLVVFVLFEIKRRQRVIPIIESPKNTSVEFVQVVGRVYYQQRNSKDIAEKLITYLLEYIRNKYRLKTSSLDQDFKESLVRLSNISSVVIEELFIAVARIQASETVNDQELIDFNKNIEQFYKQDQ